MIDEFRIIFNKTLHPKMTHCCEAPIAMPSNYFGKKQVLRGTFWAIWRIQTEIYPLNSFEPKYGAFYLKNKLSAHGLVLQFQLS